MACSASGVPRCPGPPAWWDTSGPSGGPGEQPLLMGRGTRRLPRGPQRPDPRFPRHGRESEKPNKPYGTELFALDVVAVLDYVGVHRANVLGTSTGGRLARQPAALHTHLVRAPWGSAARHQVDCTASNATAS
ncbi:alpha/beta fold hydrolase [Streptomyces globisporus]|uniref:alpha/beta fold hydrolase n=1 Tax=Streptomyces globisporus TaxID=1908 RepID=UPI0036DAD1C3